MVRVDRNFEGKNPSLRFAFNWNERRQRPTKDTSNGQNQDQAQDQDQYQDQYERPDQTRQNQNLYLNLNPIPSRNPKPSRWHKGRGEKRARSKGQKAGTHWGQELFFSTSSWRDPRNEIWNESRRLTLTENISAISFEEPEPGSIPFYPLPAPG